MITKTTLVLGGTATPAGALWSTEWTVDVGDQSVGGPVVPDCTENCLDVTFAKGNGMVQQL